MNEIHDRCWQSIFKHGESCHSTARTCSASASDPRSCVTWPRYPAVRRAIYSSQYTWAVLCSLCIWALKARIIQSRNLLWNLEMPVCMSTSPCSHINLSGMCVIFFVNVYCMLLVMAFVSQWIISSRREAATIFPRPCTLHAASQLQPIHALRLACGAQRALLPVAMGAIHDVRDRRRQTSDSISA